MKPTAPQENDFNNAEVVYLLKLSICIDLAMKGISQSQIAKTLGTSKSTVNQMLKGLVKP